MRIETDRLVVRDFERKDAENLFRIVRQTNIVRFMKDWSENRKCPQDYYGYIDWHQTQKDSVDIYQNKRYAVVLKDTDEMVGMVGMGLHHILNEVEVAYFISEDYYKMGFGYEAVTALVDWCFLHSDIAYLILTIDIANVPSQKLAQKCGFKVFEKRTLIGYENMNMKSGSYFYYRKNNPNPKQ